MKKEIDLPLKLASNNEVNCVSEFRRLVEYTTYISWLCEA